MITQGQVGIGFLIFMIFLGIISLIIGIKLSNKRARSERE